MFVKKPPPARSDPAYRKELEYLHARKSAIDNLIQSLEEYNRFRSTQTEDRNRETA